MSNSRSPDILDEEFPLIEDDTNANDPLPLVNSQLNDIRLEIFTQQNFNKLIIANPAYDYRITMESNLQRIESNDALVFILEEAEKNPKQQPESSPQLPSQEKLARKQKKILKQLQGMSNSLPNNHPITTLRLLDLDQEEDDEEKPEKIKIDEIDEENEIRLFKKDGNWCYGYVMNGVYTEGEIKEPFVAEKIIADSSQQEQFLKSILSEQHQPNKMMNDFETFLQRQCMWINGLSLMRVDINDWLESLNDEYRNYLKRYAHLWGFYNATQRFYFSQRNNVILNTKNVVFEYYQQADGSIIFIEKFDIVSLSSPINYVPVSQTIAKILTVSRIQEDDEPIANVDNRMSIGSHSALRNSGHSVMHTLVMHQVFLLDEEVGEALFGTKHPALSKRYGYSNQQVEEEIADLLVEYKIYGVLKSYERMTNDMITNWDKLDEKRNDSMITHPYAKALPIFNYEWEKFLSTLQNIDWVDLKNRMLEKRLQQSIEYDFKYIQKTIHQTLRKITQAKAPLIFLPTQPGKCLDKEIFDQKIRDRLKEKPTKNKAEIFLNGIRFINGTKTANLGQLHKEIQNYFELYMAAPITHDYYAKSLIDRQKISFNTSPVMLDYYVVNDGIVCIEQFDVISFNRLMVSYQTFTDHSEILKNIFYYRVKQDFLEYKVLSAGGFLQAGKFDQYQLETFFPGLTGIHLLNANPHEYLPTIINEAAKRNHCVAYGAECPEIKPNQPNVHIAKSLTISLISLRNPFNLENNTPLLKPYKIKHYYLMHQLRIFDKKSAVLLFNLHDTEIVKCFDRNLEITQQEIAKLLLPYKIQGVFKVFQSYTNLSEAFASVNFSPFVYPLTHTKTLVNKIFLLSSVELINFRDQLQKVDWVNFSYQMVQARYSYYYDWFCAQIENEEIEARKPNQQEINELMLLLDAYQINRPKYYANQNTYSNNYTAMDGALKWAIQDFNTIRDAMLDCLNQVIIPALPQEKADYVANVSVLPVLPHLVANACTNQQLLGMVENLFERAQDFVQLSESTPLITNKKIHIITELLNKTIDLVKLLNHFCKAKELSVDDLKKIMGDHITVKDCSHWLDGYEQYVQSTIYGLDRSLLGGLGLTAFGLMTTGAAIGAGLLGGGIITWPIAMSLGQVGLFSATGFMGAAGASMTCLGLGKTYRDLKGELLLITDEIIGEARASLAPLLHNKTHVSACLLM